MDLGVSGKGYLVVGGTQGMGLATARVLAAEGARVAVAARNPERNKEVAAGLAAEFAATVVPLVVDANDGDRTEAMVGEAVDALEGLAGVCVTASGGTTAPAGRDAAWVSMMETTLLSTVHVVDSALPHLVQAGGGTIVTTSAYSVRDPHGVRLQYTSFKSAVATYTKCIAKDYGRHGIRANCVAPGAVENEALHRLRGQLAEERGLPYEEALERLMVEEWHMDVALGRPGQPHEVGDLMAFLLSPRAGYLTGAHINIDGGTNF
jgi:3-oxoacyl-[acyl-carrier protein] reductase